MNVTKLIPVALIGLMVGLSFGCKNKVNTVEIYKRGIGALIEYDETNYSFTQITTDGDTIEWKKDYNVVITDYMLGLEIKDKKYMNKIECVPKLDYENFKVVNDLFVDRELDDVVIKKLFSYSSTRDTFSYNFIDRYDLRRFKNENPQLDFFYFSPLYFNSESDQFFILQYYMDYGSIGVLINRGSLETRIINYDCF